MKLKPNQILFAVIGLLLLLPACSKPKVQQLRTGTEYRNNNPQDESSAFGPTIYVFFQDNVVSVYKEISAKGDIVRQNSDGTLQSSSDRWDLRVGAPKGESLIKGTDQSTSMEVLFGPGDRMPVLQYAPYKIEGTSVYIDWHNNHSPYFALSGSGSGSEVFTIKNDGLVLESATSPGFILTLDESAKVHAQNSSEEMMNQTLVEQREQTLQSLKKAQELRGQ